MNAIDEYYEKRTKELLQKDLDKLCEEIKACGFDLYVNTFDVCLGSVESVLHPDDSRLVIGKKLTEEELEEL